MLSAAPVVNLPPNPGYRDPKWPKVQEAWDFFFLRSDYLEAHRALDDARHEALIAYELYKLGKFRVRNRLNACFERLQIGSIIGRTWEKSPVLIVFDGFNGRNNERWIW
jgi:hypothetical protein